MVQWITPASQKKYEQPRLTLQYWKPEPRTLWSKVLAVTLALINLSLGVWEVNILPAENVLLQLQIPSPCSMLSGSDFSIGRRHGAKSESKVICKVIEQSERCGCDWLITYYIQILVAVSVVYLTMLNLWLCVAGGLIKWTRDNLPLAWYTAYECGGWVKSATAQIVS